MYDLFFFQAEDGIRDLVRSRGLGDVYKRQAVNSVKIKNFVVGPSRWHTCSIISINAATFESVSFKVMRARVNTVSYTHLTLPTSDLV